MDQNYKYKMDQNNCYSNWGLMVNKIVNFNDYMLCF